MQRGQDKLRRGGLGSVDSAVEACRLERLTSVPGGDADSRPAAAAKVCS